MWNSVRTWVASNDVYVNVIGYVGKRTFGWRLSSTQAMWIPSFKMLAIHTFDCECVRVCESVCECLRSYTIFNGEHTFWAVNCRGYVPCSEQNTRLKRLKTYEMPWKQQIQTAIWLGIQVSWDRLFLVSSTEAVSCSTAKPKHSILTA